MEIKVELEDLKMMLLCLGALRETIRECEKNGDIKTLEGCVDFIDENINATKIFIADEIMRYYWGEISDEEIAAMREDEPDYLALCMLPNMKEDDYLEKCLLPKMGKKVVESEREEEPDYIAMCLLPNVKENRDYFADKEDYVKDMLMLPNKDDICAVCVMLPDGKEHWYKVNRDSEDIYIGALVAVPYKGRMFVAEIRRARYDAPHSLAVLEYEGTADIVFRR